MHRERPGVCHLFMCIHLPPSEAVGVHLTVCVRTGLSWWLARWACFKVAHADEGPLAAVSPRPVMLACAHVWGVLSGNEDSIGRTGS